MPTHSSKSLSLQFSWLVIRRILTPRHLILFVQGRTAIGNLDITGCLGIANFLLTNSQRILRNPDDGDGGGDGRMIVIIHLATTWSFGVLDGELIGSSVDRLVCGGSACAWICTGRRRSCARSYGTGSWCILSARNATCRLIEDRRILLFRGGGSCGVFVFAGLEIVFVGDIKILEFVLDSPLQ